MSPKDRYPRFKASGRDLPVVEPHLVMGWVCPACGQPNYADTIRDEDPASEAEHGDLGIGITRPEGTSAYGASAPVEVQCSYVTCARVYRCQYALGDTKGEEWKDGDAPDGDRSDGDAPA